MANNFSVSMTIKVFEYILYRMHNNSSGFPLRRRTRTRNFSHQPQFASKRKEKQEKREEKVNNNQTRDARQEFHSVSRRSHIFRHSTIEKFSRDECLRFSVRREEILKAVEQGKKLNSKTLIKNCFSSVCM
jgi:hypothetical protein